MVFSLSGRPFGYIYYNLMSCYLHPHFDNFIEITAKEMVVQGHEDAEHGSGDRFMGPKN